MLGLQIVGNGQEKIKIDLLQRLVKHPMENPHSIRYTIIKDNTNTNGILASVCLENYVPYGHVTKVYNIDKDNNAQIETDEGTYDINETLSVKFMLDTIEYDRFIHLDANSTLKLFSESSKYEFSALMWEVENW